MKRGLSAGIAGVILHISFGFTFDTAQAACRQVLAPNGWQYVTVCDGYRSNNNYGAAASAAVAGAAIAIELLPGLMDSVSGLTSGVGDLTSGVVDNLGNTASNAADPLQNFLSSTSRNTGGQNDGVLSPFSIFTPQTSRPTVNARTPNVNAPSAVTTDAPTVPDNSVSLFPNIFGPPSPPTNPNVRTPNVNQPSAANTPFPNIFSPQAPTAPNANAPRTGTPQANVRQPTVNVPQVNSSQPQ